MHGREVVTIIASTLKRITGWLNHGLGRRGERVAAGYLKRAGYRVLGRNLRNRFGEVDILAEAPDRQTIVVIEVKAGMPRDRDAPAIDELAPEVRVGRRKRRRLVALAGQMARRYRLTQRPIRFDIMGIDLPPNRPPVVRHHLAAFESHV